MKWLLFAIGAFIFWGCYGPAIHAGQSRFQGEKSPGLQAFLWVGAAYFLIAVLGPLAIMGAKGHGPAMKLEAAGWSTFAGALGALGAFCVILSFMDGGKPLYVMPLVFAGAPIVNVVVSMVLHPPKESPNPMLYLGFLLTAFGAGLVLYFKPAG